MKLPITPEQKAELVEAFSKMEGCTKFVMNDRIYKCASDDGDHHSIGCIGVVLGGSIIFNKEMYMVMFDEDSEAGSVTLLNEYKIDKL